MTGALQRSPRASSSQRLGPTAGPAGVCPRVVGARVRRGACPAGACAATRLGHGWSHCASVLILPTLWHVAGPEQVYPGYLCSTYVGRRSMDGGERGGPRGAGPAGEAMGRRKGCAGAARAAYEGGWRGCGCGGIAVEEGWSGGGARGGGRGGRGATAGAFSHDTPAKQRLRRLVLVLGRKKKKRDNSDGSATRPVAHRGGAGGLASQAGRTPRRVTACPDRRADWGAGREVGDIIP